MLSFLGFDITCSISKSPDIDPTKQVWSHPPITSHPSSCTCYLVFYLPQIIRSMVVSCLLCDDSQFFLEYFAFT